MNSQNFSKFLYSFSTNDFLRCQLLSDFLETITLGYLMVSNKMYRSINNELEDMRIIK